MRILLIGSTGQVAHDILQLAGERRDHEVIGLSHAQVEVTDLTAVRRAVDECQPAVVINTAAFHKTDACEDEAARAFEVNTLGPRNLALACRDAGCALLHFSTDYVFAGDGRRPYVETDVVGPINLYGISKAAGEMAVRYLCEKHYIVRTSGLYGMAGPSGKGSNFVELMLRLASEGKDIRVVNDQKLTPTATHDLATQILGLLDTGAYGTYHATCQGECSWFEFASEIFRQSGLAPSLAPQTTAQSGARARRPAYSVLDNAALRALGIDRMPGWDASLTAYLRARSQ